MSNSESTESPAAADYCREIEAYLCRKNDGHLIRIVGPAFELVKKWDEQGVPINVARAGIDRYFERYYRKGPRRRPVRIEFCEADVLDLFDDWRRAVGVSATTPVGGAAAPAEAAEERSPGRRGSLASHIERTVARLTALRGGGRHPHDLDRAIDDAVRALDPLAADARRVRGDARAAVLGRLSSLDSTLIAAAAASLGPAVREEIQAEAVRALAPFRDRMLPDAFQRASVAAFERGVRERCGLPVVSYDGG
jgi:hypothetical protein